MDQKDWKISMIEHFGPNIRIGDFMSPEAYSRAINGIIGALGSDVNHTMDPRGWQFNKQKGMMEYVGIQQKAS